MPIVPCCVSQCISQAKAPLDPSSVKIEEVRAPEYLRDGAEVMDYFALTNVPREKTEQVIQLVNKSFGAESSKFNHLKRIKERTVLIAPDSGEAAMRGKLDALLVQLGNAELITDDTQIEKVVVPRNAALTRKQYLASNAIWPVRVTTPLVDESIPTEPSVKATVCMHLNTLLHQPGVMSNGGCIFVSPDASNNAQGIGSESPLHFKHAILNAAHLLGKSSEYLATGYTVFCLGEPCVMCSMALLHSRVKEVFFLHHSSDLNRFHGLGSTVSVHCDKQTNHRFRAYRVSIQ